MFPSQKKLESASFGVSTFFASAHPSESCGSNGLPLTPNSIRILGLARSLNLINHQHLCSYIDVIRSKHERIIVVQEYYPLTLKNALDKYPSLRSEETLIKFTHQILQGIIYLNKFGTVCCNLSPETIVIDPKANVKLYGYGLYYMTEAGSAINFLIGSYRYLPPELLMHNALLEGPSNVNSVCGNPSWDSWSLGMILLEMLLNINLFEKSDVFSTVEKILSVAATADNILEFLVDSHGCIEIFRRLTPDIQDFLRRCLTISSELRPTPGELIKHPIFDTFDPPGDPAMPHFPAIDPSLCLVDISQYKNKLGINESNYKDVLDGYPHVGDEGWDGVTRNKEDAKKIWRFSDVDHLASGRSMREVYYLWQLVGGNVELELKKQKLIRTLPSILSLPSIVIKEGEIFGGGFQSQDLPTATIVLPLTTLRCRLAHIPLHKYYPLITQGECGTDELETSKLPLVIREKDVEYQFHRLIIFDRLLKAYPFKLDALIREARKDIPPFYRALIWAALLRVDGAVQERYEQIDKETVTSTDRQGHRKFTRILKAWVVSHPNLVYWQGLDSLCAPFLFLNFENEALVYACLSAFIDKYLHNFFLQDNSSVIQEYLAKFSHLIAFHDPQLFNHLLTIGFIPELYAIPWFLTMFTHVFPLHKIFLLWDTLLLGGSSLPLCIGVALLQQLKDRLLQFGFNECILLFSDMPDINMEQVVHDAVDIFCATPASLLYRHFDAHNHLKQDYSSSIGRDEELLLHDVPLRELKEELCGRISGADLLELLVQRRSSKGGRTKVLVLDVRTPEEGSLPGSLSLPYDLVLDHDGEIAMSNLSEILPQFKGRILVVVGTEAGHSLVIKVAHAFLRNGFSRVCTLHRGIEAFRSSGHLMVSSG